MPPTVTVLVDGRQEQLSSDPLLLPSQEIILSVKDTRSSSVKLDGTVKYIKTTQGLIPVDLKRSTGYHCLVVDGFEYWFATQDSKAKLEGVTQMLEDLRTLGTGWGGQILFSDGSGLRDPHVVYAWLERWAQRTLDTAESVLRTPSTEQVTNSAVSRRGGAGVDVAQTHKLIRSDPNRYLEKHEQGILMVGTERYMPQKVMARRTFRTANTAANRRVAQLLVKLSSLAGEARRSDIPREQSSKCVSWQLRSEKLLSHGLGQTLRRHATPTTPLARTSIEISDRRYRFLFERAQEVMSSFGWSPTSALSSHYSYVNHADQIFQAYCAARLAMELEMESTSPTLGAKQPAFKNEDFDLYYDTELPPEVMTSWRAETSVPDRSRPDIVLYNKASKKVAVVDAKYRARRGNATEDSRKEVSAYQALYGLKSIGIAHPGAHGTRVIEANGHRIVELGIEPSLKNQFPIAAALDQLLVMPTWRKVDFLQHEYPVSIDKSAHASEERDQLF